MKYLFFLLAGLPLWGTGQDSSYAGYIRKYKPLAIAEQKRTGVPASIKMAQALLESGAGKGELCLKSNNHFGIKCKSNWTGKTAYHDDDAKGECFRAYPQVEDSYRDHSDFLKNNSRYATLFSLDVTDYRGWAAGLKQAGYATDPAYVNRLIKLIEDHQLNRLTLEASEIAQTPEAADHTDTTASTPAATVAIPIAAGEQYQPEDADRKQPSETAAGPEFPKGSFTINGVKVRRVPAGTSMLALATENNLSLAALLEYNDMRRTDVLDKEQLIYLERKKKTGWRSMHVTVRGENLWAVSQAEGIRLQELARMNRLHPEAVPAEGTVLLLKPAGTSSKWIPRLRK